MRKTTGLATLLALLSFGDVRAQETADGVWVQVKNSPTYGTGAAVPIRTALLRFDKAIALPKPNKNDPPGTIVMSSIILSNLVRTCDNVIPVPTLVADSEVTVTAVFIEVHRVPVRLKESDMAQVVFSPGPRKYEAFAEQMLGLRHVALKNQSVSQSVAKGARIQLQRDSTGLRTELQLTQKDSKLNVRAHVLACPLPSDTTAR